ncbi:hypothetical protein Sm713_71460 [Streptomyces sp. TS71-3]|nr:hypothetical protein Sm713_71460 [Streptomyces sp. TS71-3]
MHSPDATSHDYDPRRPGTSIEANSRPTLRAMQLFRTAIELIRPILLALAGNANANAGVGANANANAGAPAQGAERSSELPVNVDA